MSFEKPCTKSKLSELNTEFLQAARNGDIKSAISSLLNGADINATLANDGNSALHLATQNNDRQMFDFLTLSDNWLEKNDSILAKINADFGAVEDLKRKIENATKNINKIGLNAEGLLPSALIPNVRATKAISNEVPQEDRLRFEFWEHCMGVQCRACTATKTPIWHVLHSKMPNLRFD